MIFSSRNLHAAQEFPEIFGASSADHDSHGHPQSLQGDATPDMHFAAPHEVLPYIMEVSWVMTGYPSSSIVVGSLETIQLWRYPIYGKPHVSQSQVEFELRAQYRCGPVSSSLASSKQQWMIRK